MTDMKNIKMKWILGILVAAFLLLHGNAYSQFTDTKEIVRHFKVTPETQIEISNKYGKIELNSWEKDSVVFEIEIKVEEKKLSKLEKAMEEIEFDFTDSQHYLVVRTMVGKNRSGLEKEFLKFKETLLQSDGNKQINYTVWLPNNNRLKVENKFGDVFIGDFVGPVEIDISNGNLKSHDFKGELDLTLNFADATINEINNARLDCNYSELYIKKAELLRIKSKSSSFDILEVKELDVNSRRDKFRIRLVDLVEASGSFSNFRMNELTDRASFRADYGDIDIEATAPDFSNIFIESKSTDINLYFNSETNFGFEITHEKTEIDFCREMNITEENTLDEKENKIKLTGNYGDNPQANNKKLIINATSGEINILAN